MSTTIQPTERTKPEWDTRAWKLAGWMSLLLAVLIIPTIVSVISNHLDNSTNQNMAGISLILALYVFPPILAGFAHRRLLLWAYLPLAAWMFFLLGGAIVDSVGPWADNDNSSPDVHFSGPMVWAVVIGVCVVLLSPLISAGPVCLYRVLRRRAAARMEAAAASMNEAIHSQREGVWPPPPVDQGPTSWP